MSITLATSKQCGPCVVVKNKLKALGLEVDIKDALEKEDYPFFNKYGIKSVPKLVIDDGNGNVEIIQGSDDIVAAVKKHLEDKENV